MFRVFLKGIICILNLYFCIYLEDWNIWDFIGTSIKDITKYKLLTNHFKPDHSYEFPSRFQPGCMKALTHHWPASFSFLAYSKQYDSVFGLPCILFDKSKISLKSKFFKNTGFSSWFKMHEKVSKHLSYEETCDEKNISNYSKHSLMIIKAKDLRQWFQNPRATVPYNSDVTPETRISEIKRS